MTTSHVACSLSKRSNPGLAGVSMIRTCVSLILLLFVVQPSLAFQEVEYMGRLEPELRAENPMAGVTLRPATDQDKLLLPALADGDIVYAGAMNIGLDKQKNALNIFVIKSSDEKRASYLYVDLNQDGKLTADERFEYAQDAATGSIVKQAIIRIPLNGAIFKSYPVRLSLPNAAPGGDGPRGPFLLKSLFTVARGTVDIDGRKTLVEYSVSPTGEIDPTTGNVAVDCDGDGKIDRNLFSSLESLTARNESIVFRVDKYYVSTKLVDTTNGRIILRAHPASDYTRIEMRLGTEVPDFTFVDFEGKARRLSDFRGKYVLLDFWGTWCAPCVAQIPHLKEVYEKYRNRGFEILGMDREMDDKQTAEKVKKFLADKGVTWTGATSESVRDVVEKRFRIGVYPTTFLLDPQGRIVNLGVGSGVMTTLDKVLPAK